MKRIAKIKKRINTYLFDHYKTKRVLEDSKGVFFALLAAFIFSFGFIAFVSPHPDTVPYFKIVTGGVSGLSQITAKVVEMCGGSIPDTVVEAIGYTCFNLPLVIFAFCTIGKRFAILTAVNVLATSMFINFMPDWGVRDLFAGNPWIRDHAAIVRVLFAGACTGVSSGLAFKGELSCGGIDIVSYYLSLRKSSGAGKYGVLVNFFIVVTFTILSIFDGNTGDWSNSILILLFSVAYLFIVSFVVDTINVRNKKVQIQLISSCSNLSQALIANFPHSATVVKGKGAYSDTDKLVIYMIVSSFEVKRVIALARKIDPHVFASVTSLMQVYGNFFIRPVE